MYIALCQKQTRQLCVLEVCYVWIWKSIKILKIVQMKQIRTGRITMKRSDLQNFVVISYSFKFNLFFKTNLPCPRAGCQRFRSISASKSMWLIEFPALLKI